MVPMIPKLSLPRRCLLASAAALGAGLALTFVTLAIPIRLEGEWITMAWAIEGAVLIWGGFRSGVKKTLRGQPPRCFMA